MFVRRALFVNVLVHGVDKREANCMSSNVAFEAAWCEPSLFDGCLAVCKSIVVELAEPSARRNSAELGLQHAAPACPDVQMAHV